MVTRFPLLQKRFRHECAWAVYGYRFSIRTNLKSERYAFLEYALPDAAKRACFKATKSLYGLQQQGFSGARAAPPTPKPRLPPNH
jgi:hypothetical protein